MKIRNVEQFRQVNYEIEDKDVVKFLNDEGIHYIDKSMRDGVLVWTYLRTKLLLDTLAKFERG
jgi:hypothetical protein